jgi:hypothetical protein
MYRIDINENPPVAETIIIGLAYPGDLLLIGNDLYITEYGADKISKIDITDPNPVAVDVVGGLAGPLNLLLDGTYIYVTEYIDGNISRFNYTDPNPVLTEVVTGLVSPNGLAIDGNDLYISERTPRKISKFDLSTLDVPSFNASEALVLFPNPSEGYIYLKGISEETAFTIISVTGQIISSGKTFSEEKINTEILDPGLYFIKLETGDVLRFIKK